MMRYIWPSVVKVITQTPAPRTDRMASSSFQTHMLEFLYTNMNEIGF